MSTLLPSILHPVVGEDNPLVVGVAGVTAILAIAAAYYYTLGPENGEHTFPKLRGVQLYHAWNFFQQRYDFVQSNLIRNSKKSFSFNVNQHRVIALAGEDARQAFYSDSHFNSLEGFKILRGTAPRIRDVDAAAGISEEMKFSFTNKKLVQLFSKARLQDKIPALLQDITDAIGRWGHGGRKGRIDPFVEINRIVFFMTARLTACDDLAKNVTDVKKIEGFLSAIEDSTTPFSMILPWFPSSARRIRKEATTDLFTLLYSYVEKRRKALRTNDAIDILIADGETTETIIEFVMGAFFAGTLNTGMAPSWALIYLATHPEWKERCREEIRNLLSCHVGTSASSPLHERLGMVPISAWEDELPILDACIREALRILMAGSVVFRRNVDEVKKIDGKVVDQGDFLAYPMADAHLNPEYYPEPYKYDPGRWSRPDPIPNAAYPFLGWGVGRHVCTGMRAAKLEMKLILAMVLMKYEYRLVDQNGKFPDRMLVPNFNFIGPAGRRPIGVECYLDFEGIVE